MQARHVYYYRFPGKPIGRHVGAVAYLTHACRIEWVDSEGGEHELLGFASSVDSAIRTAKNLRSRNEQRESGGEYGPIEVVIVGMYLIPADKALDRFLKLYWKPKGMPKAWDKTLHFKGRYVVTYENADSYRVVIKGVEYKVSKTTMEISWKDANGKPVKGGPIFARDF